MYKRFSIIMLAVALSSCGTPQQKASSKDYASEVSSYTKGLGIFMVKPCGYQITKDGYSDNIRMNEKDKLLFMFQKSMSLK